MDQKIDNCRLQIQKNYHGIEMEIIETERLSISVSTFVCLWLYVFSMSMCTSCMSTSIHSTVYV